VNLQKKLNELREEVVTALCSIVEFPDELLPHCVYVEEESEKSFECGNSVYTAYHLTRIFPDCSCILENPETGIEEKRDLREINIDWLMEVWNYYKYLSGFEKAKVEKKEIYAFLYPVELFDRNIDDSEIISGWKDGYVGKLSLDELTAEMNGEFFNSSDFWIRFIKEN
jgi:hypothetical protein